MNRGIWECRFNQLTILGTNEPTTNLEICRCGHNRGNCHSFKRRCTACRNECSPAALQSQFDGRWTLTLQCPKAPDGARGYTHISGVSVKDGMLDGDYIVPGRNTGHFHLRGPIRPDGSGYLHMSGETGQGEYNLKRASPGSPINFDLDVKFTASQGKGAAFNNAHATRRSQEEEPATWIRLSPALVE